MSSGYVGLLLPIFCALPSRLAQRLWRNLNRHQVSRLAQFHMGVQPSNAPAEKLPGIGSAFDDLNVTELFRGLFHLEALNLHFVRTCDGNV